MVLIVRTSSVAARWLPAWLSCVFPVLSSASKRLCPFRRIDTQTKTSTKSSGRHGRLVLCMATPADSFRGELSFMPTPRARLVPPLLSRVVRGVAQEHRHISTVDSCLPPNVLSTASREPTCGSGHTTSNELCTSQLCCVCSGSPRPAINHCTCTQTGICVLCRRVSFRWRVDDDLPGVLGDERALEVTNSWRRLADVSR